MRTRILALLATVAAAVGLAVAVPASPAQAAGTITAVASSGPYQDDIRADMVMTYDAGGGGNWKHFYSNLLCDEAGLSLSMSVHVSNGGAWEYLGTAPCNRTVLQTSVLNNVIYSSARYFRYEFNSAAKGKWCLWIAPRASDRTSSGAC